MGKVPSKWGKMKDYVLEVTESGVSPFKLIFHYLSGGNKEIHGKVNS
jgi:hypothetical protein